MRDPGLRARLLSIVFASTTCIGIAYIAAFRQGGAPVWASWLMAFGLTLVLVSTMAVGAARTRDDLRRLSAPFLFTLVVLLGGFWLALALPADEHAGMQLLLGLPRRAAIVVYGVGLLPLLVLPLACAWTFDELTLSQGDLDRVRDLAAAGKRGTRAPAPPAATDGAPPDTRPGETPGTSETSGNADASPGGGA